ncbi:MAG: hypothetical protein JWN80_67 [Microbacteriaceae bacterium]|nr:hypothetical protein [Microbacteriaceae bacterium]
MSSQGWSGTTRYARPVTDAPQPPTGWRAVLSNPVLLWGAFVVVHFWLGFLNLSGPGEPLGDVQFVYRFWTDQFVVAHYREGIDSAWVYPIVAMLPMLAARAFGVAQYSATWLSLVMLLDAVAFAAILGWGVRRRNTAVAWWWLGFLVLLGPIALGRIDSISVPIAIVGVLFLATRPRLAVFILTIATWIKVWPAAIIAAAIISVKRRGEVLLTAVITSAAIIAIALALGSGLNVFSFITTQTGRGLQVEAPVSTIWLWRAYAGLPGTGVYYDSSILTWQVKGAGVDVAAAVMTPLMLVVLAGVVVVGIFAARRGTRVADLLPTLSIGLVAAFIVFNKVGSPQYMGWLAVPVILGLAASSAGTGRSFRTPTILVTVVAALTQVIYPYLYGYLLGLNPMMLLVVTAKDIVLIALLAWSVVSLVQSARRVHSDAPDDREWLPEVWPFAGNHSTRVND